MVDLPKNTAEELANSFANATAEVFSARDNTMKPVPTRISGSENQGFEDDVITTPPLFQHLFADFCFVDLCSYLCDHLY